MKDEGAGVSTPVPCLLGLSVRSQQHRWPQVKWSLPKRSPVRGRWLFSRSGEWQPKMQGPTSKNAWRGLELKGFQVGCSRMCQNGNNQIETHACRPAEAFVVLPQGFRKAGKHVGNIFFPLTTLGVSPYFPTSLVGEALL